MGRQTGPALHWRCWQDVLASRVREHESALTSVEGQFLRVAALSSTSIHAVSWPLTSSSESSARDQRRRRWIRFCRTWQRHRCS